MRRALACLLFGLIAASACATPPGGGGPKPSARPTAAGKGAATPTPRATATAGGVRPQTAVELAYLAAPAAGTVKLGGAVTVDASYMVAAGAGNMVAAGGLNLVAAGGGNVMSHNGGAMVAAGGLNMVAAGGLNLIGQDGGSMVAAGAGNLVAAGGGNIVAAGAGNIVAAGGGNMVAAGAGNVLSHNGGAMVAAGGLNMVAAGAGNMVAAGAGNVLSHNGGAMVAAGGLNYRLAQATARPTPAGPPPAYGTLAPAAGMLVWVKNLATGEPVPIGVSGKANHPVYAVFSDAKGRYELHLPAALQDAVMVVAEPPFKNDRRLYYGALVADLAQEAVVDEDEALITRYLRLSGRTRFDAIVLPLVEGVDLADDAAVTALLGPELLPIKEAILPLGQALRANPTVRAAKAEDRPEHYRRIVEEMADVLLADRTALQRVRTDEFEVDGYLDRVFSKSDPSEQAERAELVQTALYKAIKAERLSAFATLKRILREAREAMTAMGAEKAHAYAAASHVVQAANRNHARQDPAFIPRPYYTFDKPGDFADFIVTEYLSHPQNEPYGCDRPGCEGAYPDNDKAIAGWLTQWGGCQVRLAPETCYPAHGFTEFRTAYIRDYMRVMFKDLGLPRMYADLLYGSGEGLATASLVQIFERRERLTAVACRYGQGEKPACP